MAVLAPHDTIQRAVVRAPRSAIESCTDVAAHNVIYTEVGGKVWGAVRDVEMTLNDALQAMTEAVE